MKRLQHKSIAAQRDDHIGGGMRNLPVATRQRGQGRLCDIGIRGGEMDMGFVAQGILLRINPQGVTSADRKHKAKIGYIGVQAAYDLPRQIVTLSHCALLAFEILRY
jgi:hypothetical protein